MKKIINLIYKNEATAMTAIVLVLSIVLISIHLMNK